MECARYPRSMSMAQELRFNPQPAPPLEDLYFGPARPSSHSQGNPHAPHRLPNGSFSCESIKCQWPCRHHEHPYDTPGFEVLYNEVSRAATDQCAPCRMLTEIADSRCYCSITSQPSPSADSHEGIGFKIYWHTQDASGQYVWDSTVSFVEVAWTCGTAQFDLCASGGSRLLHHADPTAMLTTSRYRVSFASNMG